MKRKLIGILCIITALILSAQMHAQKNMIFGLATPIELQAGETVVFLEDYFTDASQVTEIIAPDFLKIQRNANNTITISNTQNDIPALTKIDFVADAERYSILVKRAKKKTFTYAFNPQGKNYEKVAITGDFNGWNRSSTPLTLVDGKWQTQLVLNPGNYQYLVVADGMEMLDPNNKNIKPNGMGGYNTVLTIDGIDHKAIPFITTKKSDDKNIWLTHENDIEKWFVLWNNTSLNYADAEAGEIKITIPPQATLEKRSHIRVYAYNKAGESNDILIPLDYGKVITDASLLERTDLQRTIMYFVFIDRFMNGDKSNDKQVSDERVSPRANYYGGDIAGVQQKIKEKYFQDLGFNSIWISPVNQNPMGAYQEYPEPRRWFTGYHGYWPISLSQVDIRFGTNTLLKQTVNDAHANDMSIYLDYVANHIHSEHPLWEQHPEWFSELNLPDGRKNLRLWDEYRLTTWFEPFMPSFDHSKPVVAEAVADSAMFWIKEFDLDGFRHDATKHIEVEFWRLLTHKIKTEIEIPQQRNIYQIGESFGSRELIGSYISSGMLNAQFDFNIYFDARSVFAMDEMSFEIMAASLQETFDYYGYHHVMGNISGNHDLPRFISYAGKGLRWDEDEKEAGWQRDIQVEDPVGYKKLKMLHAFNATIPGVPITYYGDEIGMPGAGDPDNRRMMYFDNLSAEEQDVKNTVQKLNALRSTNMALLYGDFKTTMVDQILWVYYRTYFENKAVVFFNKSPKLLSVRLDDALYNRKYTVHFGSEIMDSGTTGFILLQPYSFEIITINK